MEQQVEISQVTAGSAVRLVNTEEYITAILC